MMPFFWVNQAGFWNCQAVYCKDCLHFEMVGLYLAQTDLSASLEMTNDYCLMSNEGFGPMAETLLLTTTVRQTL